MAEPAEDKNSVAARLDQDRRKLAIEVGQWKRHYNVPVQLKASIQRDPWPWMIGATMAGFLLSRLPARRKEVYLLPDSAQSRRVRKIPALASDEHGVREKLWSLARPLISTYVGRKIYKRVRQSIRVRA